MRTMTLTVLLVSLIVTPAWASVGGHGGNNLATTKLKIVNDSDNAIEVTVNGGFPIVLEPKGSQEIPFSSAKGIETITVALTATIAGTSFSDTQSATIKTGNRATAKITCPTSTSVAIAFSGGGLAKVALHRESRVMLASVGGLLPLLWLGALLGGRPRRRDQSPAKAVAV